MSLELTKIAAQAVDEINVIESSSEPGDETNSEN